jgi:ABC-2 type transport system permease protein
MPIFDQGYQHWDGRLSSQAARWLPITRHGVVVGLRNRWIRWGMLAAGGPPLLLVVFLIVWGLFEQKSTFITPFLSFFPNLPDELRAGPKGYRTTIWTLAFRQFFDLQLFFPMLLVLLIGPDLISQDLRFNAMPLYLSRPVRRFEYFLGKLGIIATYLAAVTALPVLVAFVLGIAFSLDPAVIRDTARVLVGSLAFSAIVVVSAGLLMLAFSSLTKNSRYVGAIWLGFWSISSVSSTVLQNTVGAEWCPLVSYTANLNRMRDALLDAGTAWDQITTLGEAGRREVTGRMGIGPFGPGRGPSRRAVPPPDRPSPGRAPADDSPGNPRPIRSPWTPAEYPWQWSASVLAGLAVVSLLILTTRVRGLDRLR